MTTEALTDLIKEGVSLWLDDLSRDRIQSGHLATLIAENPISGVTTNPTIFAAALANGHAYERESPSWLAVTPPSMRPSVP